MNKGADLRGFVPSGGAVVNGSGREQKKLVLGSRAGHIQKPPLLLVLIFVKQGMPRGEAILHKINNQHRRPLQPLGRMHRGQGHRPLVFAAITI